MRDIDAGLRAAADPARAESERAYLESERRFLGVGVPMTRRIVGEALRANPAADRAELWRAVDSLWAGDAFEYRRAAMEVLVICREVLGVEDLDRLEAMCRGAETWALLDPLRAGGGDFERFGRYADAMLHDREFFIRKAIGWVPRATCERAPGVRARPCGARHDMMGIP